MRRLLSKRAVKSLSETRESITSLEPELQQLLGILERAYDHASWHGTNLRGSIRGLTPRLAAWRPAAGRHNIWELVVHAAYWKYAARRRLSGDKARSFPLDGSNFWERPSVRGVRLQADRLRADITLLENQHRLLLATVSAVPVSELHERLGKRKETRFGLIAGVAAHDLYHAGQIQLIKALNGGR